MFSLAQNYLTRGFWGDEAWTSLISQLPYLQMLKTTAADFHPPGYYTIVEFWYKVFPTSEISTRLISIIFYLATVFMVYKLASISTSEESETTPKVSQKKYSRRWFGIVSAIVVAVNPIFFRYAFEARNYTMFAFATTASIYFLVRILRTPAQGDQEHDSAHLGGVNLWNFLGFVFFSALGIYTHYFMFFVLAAQGIYLLLFDHKIFLKMIGAYIIVGLLYLPWIPFLLGQLKSVGGGYWIGSIDWKHTHYEALLRILGGEDKNAIRTWLFSISIILMLVGLVQHARQKSFEKPYILIWLWAIVPFVLAILPGLTILGFKLPFRPIFFWRYLIPAAVPLSMIIVHAAQKLPGTIFKISVATVIVLSLAIDYLTFISYPYNFKQVYANEVIPGIQPSDKIVTVLPSFAEVFYYRNRLGLKNEVFVLPEGLVQFSGKSLLDAYVDNGIVKIGDAPYLGKQFLMTPGPNVSPIERRTLPKFGE